MITIDSMISTIYLSWRYPREPQSLRGYRVCGYRTEWRLARDGWRGERARIDLWIYEITMSNKLDF